MSESGHWQVPGLGKTLAVADSDRGYLKWNVRCAARVNLPGRHGIAVESIDAHDSGANEPTRVQHNCNARSVGMTGP